MYVMRLIYKVYKHLRHCFANVQILQLEPLRGGSVEQMYAVAASLECTLLPSAAVASLGCRCIPLPVNMVDMSA